MWFHYQTRPTKETTEKVSRVDKLKEYKEKRNKYYCELIKSIMDGAVSQCTSVVLLEPIKNHYPHYSYDDNVVVYYNEDIHKMLLDDDIATYADSGNNIVVTIDPQRVSQFKKK